MGWYEPVFARREPVIFAVAFCLADKVYSGGEPMAMTKADIIYFILIFDFIVVFTFICFINFLESRMKEYA